MTTCTNPNCSITLAPGATKCWLCGETVTESRDVEAEEAFEAIRKGWPCAVRSRDNLENCRKAYRHARRPLVEEVARLRAELAEAKGTVEAMRDGIAVLNKFRDQRLAVVADLRTRLEATNTHNAEVIAENDDLRAKLEAAERLTAHLETQHACEEKAHHAWVKWQREEMDMITSGPSAEEDGRAKIAGKLRMAEHARDVHLESLKREHEYLITANQVIALHRSRQPVDRERAIAAVESIRPRYWAPNGGGTSKRFEVEENDNGNLVHLSDVTAILGAAKAEPAKLTTTQVRSEKKGVRQAMELAVRNFGGTDGMFNLAHFSHALMEVSGLGGSVDGFLCRTILADRDDVESCETGNPRCAHYRIKPPAFVPSPTGDAPTHFTLVEKTLGRVSRELLDSQKRMRELESELLKQNARATRLGCELNQATADRDSNAAEVSRLQAEASRPCPADGMDDEELGRRIGGIWKNALTTKMTAREVRALFGKGAK